MTTVKPVDNGSTLLNPGMGWVFHHFDNSLAGYGEPLGYDYVCQDFPGASVVYLRVPWSTLEPREGEYRWAVLDAVIARYKASGRQYAFCFTTFEGTPYQGTPTWVQELGVKGYTTDFEVAGSWEPDYDDPVYLEKLENFLRAAGARYDGDPDLAFVDIGTLGVWGEGHPVTKNYPLATLRTHTEMHQRCFPQSLLVVGDDMQTWFAPEGDLTAMAYAREVGMAFRDNSILVWDDPNLHKTAHLAAEFWPDKPVILEMGHYWHIQPRPALKDNFIRYLEDVEAYHASYVSIHADPNELMREQMDVINKINLRLGYRLLPVEVTWDAKAISSGRLNVRWSWENRGVAPCLSGGYPTLWLIDKAGNIRGVHTDEALNLRDLPVGAPGDTKPVTSEISFPLHWNLPVGEYKVMVSVGDLHGTPNIALPIDGDDGQKRYYLGTVEILPEYEVKKTEVQLEGDEFTVIPEIALQNITGEGLVAWLELRRGVDIITRSEVTLEGVRQTGNIAPELKLAMPPEWRGMPLQIDLGLAHRGLLGFGYAREYAHLRPAIDTGRYTTTLGNITVDLDGTCHFKPVLSVD